MSKPTNTFLGERYISDSDGSYGIFTRLAGTRVNYNGGEDYLTSDNAIIIQWGGSPTYDSGYYARVYPLTPAGVKAAWEEFDSL